MLISNNTTNFNFIYSNHNYYGWAYNFYLLKLLSFSFRKNRGVINNYIFILFHFIFSITFAISPT